MLDSSDTHTGYPYEEVERMSITEKTYTVAGMTCGHCELSVREEVEEIPGVESAQADHTAGRLTVRGDVDDDAVRKAVEAAGYTVTT